jgi:hypothetical protein
MSWALQTAARGPGALGLAWLALACGSWTEAGVSVALVSRGATAARPLASSAGVLRVRELFWTASEIELERCSDLASSLASWLLPAAHAHGGSSPTLLSVPSVVNGIVAESTALGALSPPAGRYCSVRYRVAPADADALGLQGSPEMLHRSLLLRGQWGSNADQLGDFELLSQRVFEVEREIDLELSFEHPQATLVLGLDPERWLGSLDLGPALGAAREAALLARFAAAFDVQVE